MYIFSKKTIGLAAGLIALSMAASAAPPRTGGSARNGNRKTLSTRSEPGQTFVRNSPMRLRLKGAKMDLQMVNGQPLVKGVRGGFGGGTVRMQGNINMGSPNSTHQAEVELRRVEIAEVLKMLGLHFPGALSAPVSGEADLSWTGLEMDDIRGSASGRVRLDVGPGYVARNPLLNQLSSVAAIPPMLRLDFDSAHLIGHVHNGVLEIDEAVLEGSDLRAHIQGSVTASGELQLVVQSSVSEALARSSSFYKLRDVAQFFGARAPEAVGGYFGLPRMVVTGTLSNPTMRAEQEVAPVQPAVAQPDVRLAQRVRSTTNNP